jgi:hypothetical protein
MADSKPAVRLRDLNGRDVSGEFVPLTENRALARIAVTACIDVIDTENSGEASPRCAARLALHLHHTGWEQAASKTSLVALPTELDSVLQLRSALRRQCFVPQLLAGVRLPACAAILQTASRYVCVRTSAAALEIPRLAEWHETLSGC